MGIDSVKKKVKVYIKVFGELSSVDDDPCYMASDHPMQSSAKSERLYLVEVDIDVPLGVSLDGVIAATAIPISGES